MNEIIQLKYKLGLPMDLKVITLEGYECIGMYPDEHIIWVYGFGENISKYQPCF